MIIFEIMTTNSLLFRKIYVFFGKLNFSLLLPAEGKVSLVSMENEKSAFAASVAEIALSKCRRHSI